MPMRKPMLGKYIAWTRINLLSWMLIHAPYWSGAEGPTRDERRKVRQMKRQFCAIYAARTGKTVDRLMRDTRRQLHVNAYDALRYGLVDHIEGLPSLPATIGGWPMTLEERVARTDNRLAVVEHMLAL